MNTEIEPHPIADIFPMMTGSEYANFKDDVYDNGLLEPIWIYEEKILDGRNRYKACLETGTDAEYRNYEGSDPVGFVISLNLSRRHLNESQRAMVAANIANLENGQHSSANLQSTSRSEAAEKLNVSERTVNTAKKVQKEGAKELVDKVQAGTVSVSAAADVATLPEEEQKEVIAKGDKEIVAAANRIKREKKEKAKRKRDAEISKKAASVKITRDDIILHHEDCSAALEDKREYDWIITDPPYPAEFLDCFSLLSKIAAERLKPGGSLLCMSGQAYLPEVIQRLSENLTYQWTLSYNTPGGQAVQVFPRKVNTFWKPILWFTKSEYTGSWIGDVCSSKVNDNDKSKHHWGQSESGMADLMRRFVTPGDSVMDPFMGAGTTGVVAVDLQAKFTGYEIDKDHFDQAKVRFAEL